MTSHAKRLVSAPVPASSRALEALETRALGLVKNARRNVYELGEVWNAVAKELRATRGSAAAWWSHHVPDDVRPRTARNFGRLVAAFDESVVEAYDPSKLVLLLAYCSAKKVPLEGDPSGLSIEVPTEGGKTQGKPFGRCTERELVAAVHALGQKKAPKPAKSLPPGVADAFASLMKTLTPIVVEDDGFRLEPHMVGAQMRIELSVDANIFADVIAAIDQAALSFNI